MKSFGNQRKTLIFQKGDPEGFVFWKASFCHAPKANVASLAPSSSLDFKPAMCSGLFISVLASSEVLRGVTAHSWLQLFSRHFAGPSLQPESSSECCSEQNQKCSGHLRHRNPQKDPLSSTVSHLGLTLFNAQYCKARDLGNGSMWCADKNYNSCHRLWGTSIRFKLCVLDVRRCIALLSQFSHLRRPVCPQPFTLPPCWQNLNLVSSGSPHSCSPSPPVTRNSHVTWPSALRPKQKFLGTGVNSGKLLFPW